MLFHFHDFIIFLLFLLSLMSYLVSLGSDKIICMISIFLKIYQAWICGRISNLCWKMPRAHWRRTRVPLSLGSVLALAARSPVLFVFCFLACHQSGSSIHYWGWSITVSIMFVELSISPFNSVNFCFTHFDSLLLEALRNYNLN